MCPETFEDYIGKQLEEPGFAEGYAEALEAWELSIRISKLRQAKGLTQAQLAEMVGTKQQNIARIENPAYQGHSLGLLRKVARALGVVVHVEFLPAAEVMEREHRAGQPARITRRRPKVQKKPPAGRSGKARAGV